MNSMISSGGLQMIYFSIIALPNPFLTIQFNTASLMDPGGAGAMPTFLWPIHCAIMLAASAFLLISTEQSQAGGFSISIGGLNFGSSDNGSRSMRGIRRDGWGSFGRKFQPRPLPRLRRQARRTHRRRESVRNVTPFRGHLPSFKVLPYRGGAVYIVLPKRAQQRTHCCGGC